MFYVLATRFRNIWLSWILNFKPTVFLVLDNLFSTCIHVDSICGTAIKYSVPVAGQWTQDRQTSSPIPPPICLFRVNNLLESTVLHWYLDLEIARSINLRRISEIHPANLAPIVIKSFKTENQDSKIGEIPRILKTPVNRDGRSKTGTDRDDKQPRTYHAESRLLVVPSDHLTSEI